MGIVVENGKIFYLMGKSCAGKDTIFKKFMEQQKFYTVILLYDAPNALREKWKEENIIFVTEEEMLHLQREGKVIELRSYQTVHGMWHYFTVDDGQLNCKKGNYLLWEH